MAESEKKKELAELFESAKKASESAAADESRCLDALSQLKALHVTTQDLVATQVGRQIRSLMKHDNKKIQDLATDIFTMWKGMVLEQFRGDKGKTPDAESEKVDKQTAAPTSAALPKLNSLPKCNDALRDEARKKLCEALCKVVSECKEEMRSRVDACDPIRVAAYVESALFEEWGHSNGLCKARYRSLFFNLIDRNNLDFRRRVLLGEVEPENVPKLSFGEMASDAARHRENELIKEKALAGCWLESAPKATVDQFKCGWCGEQRTTHFKLQLRSWNERVITHVTCTVCDYRWNFW